MVRAWIGYRLCSPGSFEDGTVCSNSVKCPEFISRLSDYRLVKDSAPCCQWRCVVHVATSVYFVIKCDARYSGYTLVISYVL